MKKRRWILKEQNKGEVEALVAELKVSEVVARLLINRAYNTPEKAKSFIKKSLDNLYDPMLIPDMEKGVFRIEEAIAKKEKITIYGDYDVDGVTSSAILFTQLKQMGAIAEIYIPDRADDGYGVSVKALEGIAKGGTGLIITVDCGITAMEEVAFAKGLGLDMIITDHHECKEVIPEAYAVINPKRPDSLYPFKDLAGVGVTFKLICALMKKERVQEAIERYCELVAFGTIADVMPLSYENRILVAFGLQKITHTTNKGLRALIIEAGLTDKKITAGTIGYALAPRVNAAGRISSAMLAVRLLLTEDGAEATALAKELCEANKARQEEENGIFLEAIAQIKDHHMTEQKILVLSQKNWHHGIIGIVASRITDLYYLPSVMLSFDEEGNGKGSCRSIPSFSIYNALEKHNADLEKFGGHALAAGISISAEKFPAFKEKIEAYAREHITDENLEKCQEIDCEVFPSDITTESIESLSYLEPYGMGNPSPVFLCQGLKIVEIRALSGDKHTRLTLMANEKNFFALAFGQSTATLGYYVHDIVDICCNLDINMFRGEKQTQVVIKDIRKNEALTREEDRDKALFEKYLSNTLTDEEKRAVAPVKADFVTIYRAVRQEERKIDLFRFTRKYNVTFMKLVICMDVFEEMGLLRVLSDMDYVKEIEVVETESKINLLESKILKNLGRISS